VASIYPKPIQELTEFNRAYKRQEVNAFRSYVEKLITLSKKAQLETSPFVNLTVLLEAYTFQDTLDMRRVEADHTRLIHRLKGRLSPQQDAHLGELQRALETEEIPELEYHNALASLASMNGISLTAAHANSGQLNPKEALLAMLLGSSTSPQRDFLALRQYLTYLRLVGAINPWKVEDEAQALETIVLDAYLTTHRQQTLARLLKQLQQLNHLVALNFNPQEWDSYQASQAQWTFEAVRSALHTVKPDTRVSDAQLRALLKALPVKERFYTLANTRDESLSTNTLERLRHHATPSAILITGGFHTKGITQQFKQNKIAYAVIAPQATDPLDEAHYHALLNNNLPTPQQLEKSLDRLALMPSIATTGAVATAVELMTPYNLANQVGSAPKPAVAAAYFLQSKLTFLDNLPEMAEPLLQWVAQWGTNDLGLVITAVSGGLILTLGGMVVSMGGGG